MGNSQQAIQQEKRGPATNLHRGMNLSVADYFLKIKNLCSEISLLNPEEAISEARQRRCIIRGLRPEFMMEMIPNFLSFANMMAKKLSSLQIIRFTQCKTKVLLSLEARRRMILSH